MSRTFRVAHLLPWTGVGGTEHATLRVAQAAAAAGYESVAFHLEGADEICDLFRNAGIATTAYQAPQPSVRHGLKFWSESQALAGLLREHKIDLLHCADYLAGWFGSTSGKLAGIPVLCHVRNRFDTVSRRDRLFLSPVQKFAFVSQDTWRHFAYPVAPRRGVVVYDGLEVNSRKDGDGASVRRELGIGDDEQVVGMVARVAPQKDYATLAEAAAQVLRERPSTRFVVIGDHSSNDHVRHHYAEVLRWVQELGITDRFLFTGARPDVTRMLRALDVFVLSTHHEGLPLVVLEAMAESLPVVATAVDGIPEIVTEGETGFLTPHADAAVLSDRILRLLAAPTERFRLGQMGAERVRTRFSREQFAHSVQQLYAGMLGNGG